MRIVLGMAAAALLAGCQGPAEVSADGAWVRLPAVVGRPGAAYFTVHGGREADALLAVSAPFALRAELHESMPDMTARVPDGANAPMMMKPIQDIAVPAGGTVAFAPGGKHVMLFSVAPTVSAGAKVPLTLSFASGKRIDVQADVVGPGDPAPN